MRRFRLAIACAVAAAVSAGVGTAAGATPARATAAAAGAKPARTTGNVLVLLDRHRATASATQIVRAAVARVGGRPAGHSVPEIGLITVRPGPGGSPTVLARRLAHLPGVAAVELEHRYVPRIVPNDPALNAPDQFSGVLEWALAREGFYNAWNVSRGDGALVGVIDTGIDASHPDLSPKIAVAVDQQDPSDARGTARTDEVGHGTHVSSLACAATGNGIGMAGAGYDCRLVVEKSDFTDSSIAAAVVDAANRHVQALNMSFGPSDPATASPPPDSEVRALEYAAARNVVLVAAAADTPAAEQGDPGNVLQPSGTGSNLAAGIGLDVTAADANGHRASFAGFGSEISLAAYGALQPDNTGLFGIGAPDPGIFGAFPSGTTDLEGLPTPCGCRTTFMGSNSYAFLQGTSMAAPQVAATAALMRVLNPDATLADVLTTLKRTAQRPAGTGWTSDLGWGILNAGAALDVIRRIDRLPPVSQLVAPRISNRRRFVLRWSGHDQTRPEVYASGLARFYIYVRVNGSRSKLIAATSRHSMAFAGRPGSRYVFFSVAVDRAGNRQVRAVDVTTRVARRAR